MRNLVWLSVLVASMLGAAPARADQANVPYGPDPQEQMDICVPPTPQPGMPALLMIHGGGWHNGSRHGQAGVCRFLARMGIAVFTADYRLFTDDPASKWPAQIEDAQLAMRWVRAHAATYGFDPRHVCVEGDSAGGQLALMLDTQAANFPGDRAGMLGNVSPRADCVVSISGITDFVTLQKAHPGYANTLFALPDAASLQAARVRASPALQVRPGDGPAFLLHGLQDPAVPFAQAEEMRDAFARAGTPAWLISHEGGHEMNGMTPRQAHDIWAVIGNFVKARGLGRTPMNVSVDQILP